MPASIIRGSSAPKRATRLDGSSIWLLGSVRRAEDIGFRFPGVRGKRPRGAVNEGHREISLRTGDHRGGPPRRDAGGRVGRKTVRVTGPPALTHLGRGPEGWERGGGLPPGP